MADSNENFNFIHEEHRKIFEKTGKRHRCGETSCFFIQICNVNLQFDKIREPNPDSDLFIIYNSIVSVLQDVAVPRTNSMKDVL